MQEKSMAPYSGVPSYVQVAQCKSELKSGFTMFTCTATRLLTIKLIEQILLQGVLQQDPGCHTRLYTDTTPAGAIKLNWMPDACMHSRK